MAKEAPLQPSGETRTQTSSASPEGEDDPNQGQRPPLDDDNNNNTGPLPSPSNHSYSSSGSRIRLRRPRRLAKRSQSLPIMDNTEGPAAVSSPASMSSASPSKRTRTKTRNKKSLRRGLSLELFQSSGGATNNSSRRNSSRKQEKSSLRQENHGAEEPSRGREMRDNTRIVTELTLPPPSEVDSERAARLRIQTKISDIDEEKKKEEDDNDNLSVQSEPPPSQEALNVVASPPSFLNLWSNFSYLDEMLCGSSLPLDDNEIATTAPSASPVFIPDDPTVQESIECILSSTDFRDRWEGKLEESSSSGPSHHNMIDSIASRTLPESQSKYSYPRSDSSCDDHSDKASLCPCRSSELPSLPPQQWPQAPLLLRPAPGTNTKIKGIRFGSSNVYLWTPNETSTSWHEQLVKLWGRTSSTGHDDGDKPIQCCSECAVLPINNGNEAIGESLVIDFETDHFEGSFLLRLRFSEGTTPEPYSDSFGYFNGVNRRFQAVVRGRFKQEIPFVELHTGFKLRRPCGKLPAKWILRGGMKVISFFAPQLSAKLEGSNPCCLTPLGSTPQSIQVDADPADLMEDVREEPKSSSKSLLGTTASASSSVQRARARKKAFDRMYVQKDKSCKTDPTKVYTFEFLQHLFDFQKFSLELGSMVGSVPLVDPLDGQPFSIMAFHGEKVLWAFEIWHESLYEHTARKHK